jgi:GTP-binding protein HflX
VHSVLAELGIDRDGEGRMLEVWNKVDLLPPEKAEALAQVAARTPEVVVVSALTGAGVPALMAAVAAVIEEPRVEETLALGFEEGRKRAWLFDRRLVRAERPTEAGYEVAVRWTDRERSQYLALG